MKKLSIAVKIGSGFLLVLIMFTVVSIVSIQNTKKLKENENWVDHTNEVLFKIENVLGHLKDAETGQRGFIITGLERYLEPYEQAIPEIQKDVSDLKQLTSDNDNQQRRIENLNTLISDKLAELKQTIDLRRDSGFEAAHDVVVTDAGKKVMDDIREILDSMIEEENNLLQTRKEVALAATNTAKSTILWFTIIAGVIVILLVIYYVRIIAVPIKKLSVIAKKTSLGEITAIKEDTNRKDEIGVLIESFKQMQEYLLLKAEQANKIAEGDLTIEVKAISDDDIMGVAFTSMIKNLRQQINEITEGVNVISSSSSEIMAMVSQLASGSAETASSISETSSTIEEIKQTAEVSNQKAIEVAESAAKIAGVSQNGNKAVTETIEGMNKIKQQMESIAAIVIQLSEKSIMIGDITTAVNDIAEQSNLLAVNASIEAAKAGEQGKGFSVVAQEIKNLSERSKESTAQIKTIISDIQKEISRAVMATEQGGKVIDEGLRLSSSASEVITTLAASIEQAAQSSLQIAAASQQQVVGMDQIATAMESINETSVQSSSSAKQTEESLTGLNDLGVKLLNLMKKYKLK
ncbi:MAG: CHASE3 domain-containing protein [Salinivirgaceae bacterium]|nr:CHASE3 domain-containing protein [Salinivirgaceae bacterium]